MNEGDAVPDIGCYGVIGNCRTAALISDRGSIDWLCLPRFDSPSILGALLDRERGGHFTVAPPGSFASRRRYLPDTNVLETTFTTGDGVLRLVDFMPVATEEQKRRELLPDHQILRLLECLSGEVEVRLTYAPRPGYGAVTPRLRRAGALGILYEHGADVLALQSDLPLALHPTGSSAEARARLHAGERRWVSLAYTAGVAAVLAPPGARADEQLRRSVDYWRTWIAGCHYEGPWNDAVRRSALVLKLLTFAPSGAVVAAPTTSLPERIGGVRNWDYRFCWLRDASLTTRALFSLGFADEASAFIAWLLHATWLTWPELRVVYDVFGGTRLPERELPWLAGYRSSRPVRVGNGAGEQFQLDVYGEVTDATLRFITLGGALHGATGKVLRGLGDIVARRWTEADQGIWEERGGPRQHTFSKAMSWIALDRLIQMYDRGHLAGPAASWRQVRGRIRAAVEEHGYNESLGSYTSTFDGEHVDASLLQLANLGYERGDSPRMRGTIRRVREQLGAGGPLLCRYRERDDGLPAGEGAFGICSYWAVEARARAGEVDAAAADLDELLGYANDLGLYAEEIDPASGSALGNFPQGFTHIGLINAAVTIARIGGTHETPPIHAHAQPERRHV